MSFQFSSLVTSSLLLVSSVALAQGSEDYGPAYDRFSLTIAPGDRTEAAGPFYYREHKDTQKIWAVPPIFSYTTDKETDYTEMDIAYPFISYDRFGEQYRFHIFQLLSFAGGPTQDEKERDRFTLFPVFFLQRSSLAGERYMALVPLYGHLKNRLFRDEVFFVMMPFYVKSRKKDVVTYNMPYPFFHLRYGTGLTGWQFFPITGHEHKDVTTQTNGFGDVSTVAGHEKFFVLWPFFFNEHTGIGTDNPVWQQASLPSYTLTRSPLRDSTTVLWPFFTFVNDREKKYREWEVPWPFLVFARGEGKTTTRFFPLFSRAHSAVLESDFYLWPLYKYNRAHSDPLDRERTRILFFLYSDTKLKNTETQQMQRRVDFWPFFTHQKDFKGNTRLQVLAVLEPYLPNSKSIERDYSQLWSFWRSEHNVETGDRSQSLLWNLYRRQKSGKATGWSAFFGMFGSRTTPDVTEKRIFYFPIRHKTEPLPTLDSIK